ncbi:Transverse filament protein of the synaptonemal complexis, partial [Reticulomyxa filosa]
ESNPSQFKYSNKEELMNYIKKITQTHRLKLWDEAFDTWEKAYFFAETICPELIEVPHFSFLFNCVISYIYLCICEFNRQLCLINEEHEKQINMAHSSAQEQYNSQQLELETDFGNFFAYKCKGRNLAEMRGIARELSVEKINSFFSTSHCVSFSKDDFDNGVKALAQWIPDTSLYHPFSNNDFRNLGEVVKNLYRRYEKNFSQVSESVKNQFEKEKRDTNKDNQTGEEDVKQNETVISVANNYPRSSRNTRNKNRQQSDGNKSTSRDSHTESVWVFFQKSMPWLSDETQLTEEENQEIESRLDHYDYSPLHIELIAGFGQIYEKYKRIFLSIDPIKSVSLQENELKKKYRNDRLQRELELNKIFLKKLDERMDNGNPLSCVIEKKYRNKIKANSTFDVFIGDFTTQESRPDHLELKQVMQKNNEFDIRGNEELVFAYGLTNNEMVLVVSIDKNVSDALPVDATNEEEKKNDKQDVWNEQYNQNCVTRIFLSSRQILNKKKANEELQGKITLAALSEQKHLMVLYERARQLIHVYKWNERITDSLQQLKNKTVRLCDQVLPDNFYVLSMCFDNKDSNLYILDNKNTIRCIALDTGLFNNEREIICKEQYSKVMMTLEGGYIVGIKPQEQEEEKEQQEQVVTAQSQMQVDHDNDIVTEGNIQTRGENNEPGNAHPDTKGETQPLEPESITTITTASPAIIPPVKRTPTGLVQCDFYALDDSKELVRSLVLPKEFTPNGIYDVRLKLILQKQIYIAFLNDQFVLHCLPLQVSLKKSQLHIKLTSIDDRKFRAKKPNKLDYIEYNLDKFGSKPEFYSQPKLALHLSVLLDANESKSSSSSSWISRERITQASELVLHARDK